MITAGAAPVGVEQPKLPLALVNVVPTGAVMVSTMLTGATEGTPPTLKTSIVQKIAVGPFDGSR
ncbi:hypothetical protein [Phenylobacterium sp. J367]|uniref:hypothetical protein n=1 Tax=Phenylobacterium sp. J367 TaxID=2898435 RepID=UPI002151E69B|nr:hypothetical protein [Phenylobacterium sp. J367]MCR5879653.1 hypothetical protein [Phenylobacterium sp. J367]